MSEVYKVIYSPQYELEKSTLSWFWTMPAKYSINESNGVSKPLYGLVVIHNELLKVP
jgi:hypothetical protein